MVDLGKKTAYLVLDSKNLGKRRFQVVETLQDVLKDWNSSTRFSPAHPLSSQGDLTDPFGGHWHLMFFGPCHPFDFAKNHDSSKALLWFTLGLYNVLHATRDDGVHTAAKEWVLAQGIPCEIWRVEDGIIGGVEIMPGKCKDIPNGVQDEISQFPYEKAASAIRPSLLEYLPLLSATLHKSSLFAPRVLEDIQQFHKTVGKSLGDCATDFEALEKLNLLTIVNAGLSHFC